MRGVPFTPTRPEQSEQLYPGRYVEPVSDARTTPGERCVSAHRGWAGGIKPFFTIPLTHCHHAVQRNLRPMLLIVRNDDMVHDVAVGKIFHRPAEMGSVDPEHRRALADRGGEAEDLLIGKITLQSIDQVQFGSYRPDRPGWRR